MKAMILAAGLGTRLLPLTKNIPKCMVEVASQPFIFHQIQWMKENGITEIAINLHHLPEKITNYLGDGSSLGVNIVYSLEKSLLGTAGGVKKFEEFFDDDFLVYYGDVFTTLKLAEMKKRHLENKALLTILTRTKAPDEKKSNLIVVDQNKKIKKFIEKPTEQNLDYGLIETIPNRANCGIYMCSNKIFSFIPSETSCDFGYDIIPKIISNDNVFCFDLPKNSYWCEIGKLEKYNQHKPEIEKIVQDKKKLQLSSNQIQKKRAVFIDRDGVINKIKYNHEIGIYSPKTVDEFEILDGVVEAIKKIHELGFLAIVVSNQPGIDFGYLKKEELKKMDDLVISLGADAVYNCTHHPDWSGQCDCRKPKSGLLHQAAIDFDIDIASSYMIGDNVSDIQAGKICSKTILIGTKRVDLLNYLAEKNIHPDVIVNSLLEATHEIELFENKN